MEWMRFGLYLTVLVAHGSFSIIPIADNQPVPIACDRLSNLHTSLREHAMY
jgi:hypothetical protein